MASLIDVKTKGRTSKTPLIGTNPESYQKTTWWRHQMETFSAQLALCEFPVNSPHKGQWRGALMFSFICVWINDWVNNREAGDLRRYSGHYDVIVMKWKERAKWRNLFQIFTGDHFICYQDVILIVYLIKSIIYNKTIKVLLKTSLA